MNRAEERLFRAIIKFGKRPTIDVGVFSGNLKPDELIDWINELEEYFEYKNIRDLDRVKFAKAKMKGHAKIWWQEVQLEINRTGKEKITRWDHMVDKLKKQFIPIDYELDLFRKMQGLSKQEKLSKNIQRNFINFLLGQYMQNKIRRRLPITSVGYDLTFKRS